MTMRPQLRPVGTAFLALLFLVGVSPVRSVDASDSKPQSKTESTNKVAWLGVSTQTLDDQLRDGIDYRGPGVLVNQVVEGGPAEKAGVKAGDVIVSVNGQSVGSPDELQALVRRGHAGDRVRLDLARENKRQALTATLGERSSGATWSRTTTTRTESDSDDNEDSILSDDDLQSLKNLGDMPIPGRGRLGVQLQDLDGDLGSYFSVPQGKGALIVEVEKESPAARAGLKAGDVIVKVGEDSVEDSNDAARAIREREGKTSFTIVRRGQRQTVTADLAPRARIRSIVRGHGPMVFDMPPVPPMPPMAPMAPMTPMSPEPMNRSMSRLHREMDQLRDEIRQLREELQQKSKN